MNPVIAAKKDEITALTETMSTLSGKKIEDTRAALSTFDTNEKEATKAVSALNAAFTEAIEAAGKELATKQKELAAARKQK
jgi:hypothetical protein